MYRYLGFPSGLVVKNPLQCRGRRFNPWLRKIPWRRSWLAALVFLPGESHGQRSMAGYSPWGHKELDMTEQLSTHKYINNSLCYTVGLCCLSILSVYANCKFLIHSSPSFSLPWQPVCSLGLSVSVLWSEVKWKSLSHVWLFVTPWTVQPMEFSRPEYWSG